MTKELDSSRNDKRLEWIYEYAIDNIKIFLKENNIPSSEIKVDLNQASDLATKYALFCERQLSYLCQKYSRSKLMSLLSMYEEQYLSDFYRFLSRNDTIYDPHEATHMRSEAYLTAKLAALKFGSDSGWAQLTYKEALITGGPNCVTINGQELLDIKKMIFWGMQHVEAQYGYRTIQRMSLNDKEAQLCYDPLKFVDLPFSIFETKNKDLATLSAMNMHFYFQRRMAEGDKSAQLKFNLLDSYQSFTFPLYSHKVKRIAFLDLSKSFEYYKLIREPIEQRFGFTLEEMYAFLAAMGDRITNYLDSQSSGFRLGLVLYQKKNLIDYISKEIDGYYNCLIDDPRTKRKDLNWRRTTHMMLNRFTLTQQELKSIDLWTARPLRPFQDIETNFISCDLSSISFEYFCAVFWEKELGKSDIDRDVRGRNFEQHMNELIMKYCNLLLLGVRSKVKNPTTGELVTDLDLCYKVGDYLFIVECKARSISERAFRGDEVVAFSNWGDIVSWLKNLDLNCQQLAEGTLVSPVVEHAKCLGARYIVPILCILDCQYLLDYSDNMVLAESGFAKEYIPIPRVCTPYELVYFFNNIDDSLANKPFSFPIK